MFANPREAAVNFYHLSELFYGLHLKLHCKYWAQWKEQEQNQAHRITTLIVVDSAFSSAIF